MNNTIVPIILSGGAGTRLWPVSRESHPKPFIKLPDGQSLLQKTFLRAASLANAVEILTITNKEYYLKSIADYEKLTSETTLLKKSYLLEPFARNTAPAILLAALKIKACYGGDAILLVLPADHLIADIQAFNYFCQQAFTLAKQDKLVTFGIQPSAPETGFGYIELGQSLALNPCYAVKRFVEKPNVAMAKTYLQSNAYVWNAGMFCFTADKLINEFAKHAPALLSSVQACWEASHQSPTATIIELMAEHFSKLENISIDYALMEKSTDIAVVKCDFAWEDIGSWEAYQKLHQADQQGNTILGEAILIDSKNNFIHSEDRMVASIGIQDLAII
ncbi:MAG: mannose-1-phosphate guanylyltransferase, partial [Gammaproteobacteria bacterium]|nr:mannose-1-phosphate guanylyltransferase [Gammaproteobacteria bacterium]